METRLKRFLLAATAGSFLLLSGTGLAHAQTRSDATVQVIDPDIERRQLTVDDIDSENFEIGAYVGIISIEDFDSETVIGARLAYHFSEALFFEASYGESEGDQTSYEEISGGPPLFNDSDRDYTYYNFSVGWNIFPGEVFIGDSHAFKSDFYLIAGAGSTSFLGDDWFTATFGAGYRLMLNDWFAWRLDVRDHIFDRDSFGEDTTTNNIEFTTGVSFFF
jgi:outer membrane beta-barrel protein